MYSSCIQLTSTADYLAEEILKIGDGQRFELLSDINGKGLPLVAWRFKGQEKYDGMSNRTFYFTFSRLIA